MPVNKNTALIVFTLACAFNTKHPRFKKTYELDEYDSALLKARYIASKAYVTIKMNVGNVKTMFDKRRMYFHKMRHDDFIFLAKYYTIWTYQWLK